MLPFLFWLTCAWRGSYLLSPGLLFVPILATLKPMRGDVQPGRRRRDPGRRPAIGETITRHQDSEALALEPQRAPQWDERVADTGKNGGSPLPDCRHWRPDPGDPLEAL